MVLLMVFCLQLGCATVSKETAVALAGSGGAKAGYLLLADGSIHSERDGVSKGLFVRGKIEGKHFVPEGDVKGEGELGSSGHPGWMELDDGTFYGDETARVPRRPYVRGYRGSDGQFRPALRTVVY